MTAKARGSKARASSRQKLDSQLDAALANTFPASDPVAVGGTTSTEAPAHPVDRKAPIIDAEEVASLGRTRQPSS